MIPACQIAQLIVRIVDGVIAGESCIPYEHARDNLQSFNNNFTMGLKWPRTSVVKSVSVRSFF